MPLKEIEPWIYAYCSQPGHPVRLTRRQPDAQLWFLVMSGQLSIASLTDCQVQGLRYLLRGARRTTHVENAVSCYWRMPCCHFQYCRFCRARLTNTHLVLHCLQSRVRISPL